MRGVVVAGLIAAVMAALSAQVNSASTLFSTDIYKKLIRREAGDREMVRVGRIAPSSSLLLGGRAFAGRRMLAASSSSSSSRITAIAIPFMATVLMGILWKRVNYAAGMFGLVGGVLITAPAAVFSGYLGGDSRTALLLHRRHR